MTGTVERLGDAVPTLTVVRVNKSCRQCGKRWRGLFFQEWIKSCVFVEFDGKKHIRAYCDACIDGDEQLARVRGIERDIDSIQVALSSGPTKARKIRLMRRKERTLIKLREEYEPGGLDWSKTTDRIKDVNDAIRRLDDV